MRKPTLLQQRFVEIYHSMKKPNKREAYEQVYQARGETARVEAERTLRLPHVKAYLKKLQVKSEAQAVKSAGDIIKELEKVGFSNIKDYIKVKNGKITLKDLKSLSEENLAAIAEISETTTQYGGAIKFKLYDKLRALKDLGLRFGIFPTKIEHTGEITLAQAVHKAMSDEQE